MGKYDKIYENYYKKIDSGDKSRERENDFDYEDLYQRNGGRKNSGGNQLKGTIIALTIPVLILGGFGIYKFAQTDQGKELYNKAMSFVESNGIGIVKSEDAKANAKKEIDKGLEKEIGEDAIQTSVAPTSFVLNDENVEKVKSDDRYSKFVSALNGVEVKAKSEEGLVLSCKYKIIASALSGVVETIGENAEGYFLVIDHGDDMRTFYYNLPELDYVKGQAVKKGEKIAEIKETKDIVFKIKENDKFVTPRKYVDFIK